MVPAGAVVSSLTAERVPLVAAVGWSLTGLTVRATVSETIEKGVLPPVPVVVMLAVVPALPADWSQARKVMDSVIAPCQLAAGWK